MKEIFLHERDIPDGCYCCDFRDPRYDICIASREGDDYMCCKQPKGEMNGKKPNFCPMHSIESVTGGVNNVAI